MWADRCGENYRKNIDQDRVNTLIEGLDVCIEQELNMVTPDKMDSLVEQATSILLESARSTGIVKANVALEGSRARNKPWFNQECKDARKRYQEACNVYRHTKLEKDKEKSKLLGKSYI